MDLDLLKNDFMIDNPETGYIYSASEDVVLYHYTDAVGLKGIIENKEMWATNFKSLNDKTEFETGINLIKMFIEKKFSKESTYYKYTEEFINNNNFFVTSFSSKMDDLCLWNGYCPSGGYCIKFNIYEIINNLNPRQFKILKCQYNDCEDKIEKILHSLECLFNNDSCLSECSGNTFKTHLNSHIRYFSLMFKNKFCSCDKEWRVVCSPDKDMLKYYRNDNFLINNISYVKFPIPLSSIKEIIIGIQYKKDKKNISSLEKFLKNNNISPGITLTHSPL